VGVLEKVDFSSRGFAGTYTSPPFLGATIPTNNLDFPTSSWVKHVLMYLKVMRI
jgi:hypothetical protein